LNECTPISHISGVNTVKHKLIIILSLVFAAVIFAFIGCGGGGGGGTTPPDGNGGGDTTAPSLKTMLPEDEATNIPLNSNLVITFDEVVTVGTGNLSIYDSGDVLFESIAVGSAQVTAAGADRFVIDPSSDFTASTDYYVKIDAGAFKDTSNNNFAGITDKTTWNFQTGTLTDATAPTIANIFPADNATGVAFNVNLAITFSEAVIPGTGNVSIYDSTDTLFQAIAVDSLNITGFGTDTVTINPSNNFAASTDYYVQIDAGAFKDVANQDFAGIVPPDKTTWNFQTGLAPDSTPPSVSSLSPLDDATDVLPTANLVITFNEEVIADAGTITIYDSGDALFEAIDVTSAQVTGSGTDTITIDPTDDFTELTNYYVLIDPGAFTDTANNDFAGITSNTSWNFGVKDNTPPTIVKVYPVDGGTAVPTNANLIIVFSEPVNLGSSGNIYVYDNNAVLKDTINVITDSAKFTGLGTSTIVIDRDDLTYLSASLNHYVQIDDGAFVDTTGSSNSFAGISDTTTWNFTTAAGADTTAPSISSRIPSIGAPDVPLNTNLQIKFNEVVFTDSGNITINNAQGTVETIDVTSSQVTGSWTDTIDIDPADFPISGAYWVKIDATAFYDISGNYFTGILDTSWIFTVSSSADTTPPSVSVLSPADDATDVVLVSDLEIDFTETVYADSGSISIYDSGDTLIEQIDVTSAQVTGSGTSSITVSPSSDFEGSEDYYVQVDATAFKDVANNYFAGISDATTWSFTTEIGALLTDPFDYGGVSGDLDTISSIWSEVVASSSQKVQYDNATGLSFTSYSTGSGGSATGQNDQNGGAMGQGFTVGAVTDDGAMYFGVIVNRLTTADNSDTGPGILFYDGTTALGGVSFTAKTTPSGRYNIILDGGGASTATLKNNALNGTDYLIIIRYDFVNETLDGWLDPDVSLAETAPNVTLSGISWSNIDKVAIDQTWRGIASPSNTYRADEIKVTKSWGLLAE
jgi:hypothetical protein